MWTKKANTSESPFKCRNCIDGIETGEFMLLQDESDGNLFTGQMVPGIEVTRAWSGLF